MNLDEESSYLTTYHASLGRYRQCRVSFGISSVLQVFQQRMHELGLTGTEVDADYFMVTGFGGHLWGSCL